MRVLFANQLLGFQPGFFGGVEIQMQKTREYLKRLEVEAKFFQPSIDRIVDFDIVHLFMPWMFPSEAMKLVYYARGKGIKVVASPVFWDFFELNYKSDLWYKKPFYVPYYLFRNVVYKYSFDFGLRTLDRYVAKVFKNSDLLLPNSDLESELIVKMFNIDRKKVLTVPNGVDQSFAVASPRMFVEKYGLSDFILFVGRIDDPRKNVSRLIRAFDEAEINTQLVIIGSRIGEERSWNLNSGVRSRILHLESLPHESELLKSAYAASKVFALPSWIETPGLAALEAAIAGANVVITDRGSTREYFGEQVWYVDPSSVESIKTALTEAYHSKKRPELREHILSKYTWDRVATETLKAYKKTLNE